MDYVTDMNGNKASIKYFGSKEAAQKSLKTLKNCHDCINCNHCINCTDCIKIRKCKNSLIVGGFRSDRHQFVMSESGSVHAGCRVFENITKAREHWVKTRINTKLGDETFALLDVMEKLYTIKKEMEIIRNE